MTHRTIARVSELIRGRQLSSVTLVRECLDAIDQLNPSLNAFITVTADAALANAEQADREIQSGHWRGPLHGIPIGLKDLIDTANVRTTSGSAVFLDRIPTEDAEVVTRLKAAGAIIIGKQNLHEFAYGASSVISHFGPVRNPVDPEFITGGSSGGSAAAVASGMCYGAIGTDTAGSIREPAALCGVVGLKPSYGLVSTRGIMPLAPSLDHTGPITRSTEDAAILLDALVDGKPAYRASLAGGIESFVIGVPRTVFFDDLDADVSAAIERAISRLATIVASVRDVDLPVDSDRTLQSAESFASHRDLLQRSSALYHPETLRRLRTGESVSANQYQSALRDLHGMRAEIGEHFRDVDVVVMPTTPIPAPRISDLTADLSRLRPAELRLLRNTRPANVWGLPAISVPCGVTSAGSPIGLQIVGPPGGDANVLRVAHAYEALRSVALPGFE